MASHTEQQEIARVITALLECSVYVSPLSPGLTFQELLAACNTFNFQPGEVSDSMRHADINDMNGDRLLPNPQKILGWVAMNLPQSPEYISINALDFIYKALHESARAVGNHNARIERSVLTQRALAKRISKNEMDIAFSISLISEHLIEKDGVVRVAPGRENWPLPSEQRRSAPSHYQVNRNPVREKAYGVVKDIVGRRTDGRPTHPEPLDAFADALVRLGYGPFRLWWMQIVVELRLADTESSPVTVSVLAAALVEGALTFVVKHARALGLGALGSKTFDETPQRWKIEELVTSAAAGKETAILDGATRQRADMLIRTRRRIHAGGMLAEYPTGVPDLRPEEAREAKATTELVVRRVLDWLERYPPSEA